MRSDEETELRGAIDPKWFFNYLEWHYNHCLLDFYAYHYNDDVENARRQEEYWSKKIKEELWENHDYWDWLVKLWWVKITNCLHTMMFFTTVNEAQRQTLDKICMETLWYDFTSQEHRAYFIY
jgi:hypothetical protein